MQLSQLLHKRNSTEFYPFKPRTHFSNVWKYNCLFLQNPLALYSSPSRAWEMKPYSRGRAKILPNRSHCFSIYHYLLIFYTYRFFFSHPPSVLKCWSNTKTPLLSFKQYFMQIVGFCFLRFYRSSHRYACLRRLWWTTLGVAEMNHTICKSLHVYLSSA